MPTIVSQLDHAFRAAITAAFGLDADPLVGPAQNEKFGDYQANAAMGLAKVVGEKTGQKTNPRAVAEAIIAKLDLGTMGGEITIAGPGFINVKLSPEWLGRQIRTVAADPRLGIEKNPHPRTVIVDYSGPNVAKQMHVGHLRSTIIGDAIARVLEFEGDDVIRQNHIGDWGTQFGKVVLAMWYGAMANHLGKNADVEVLIDQWTAAGEAKDETAKARVVAGIASLHREFVIADPTGTKVFEPYLKVLVLDLVTLERLYQFVGAVVDHDAATREIIDHPQHGGRTLKELPRLITTFIQHPEDHDNSQEQLAWLRAREVTLKTCDEIYRRLSVQLANATIQNQPLVRGESFYNTRLPAVVVDLKKAGIAVASQGATAVFVEGFETPLIIEKGDGGFLYGTTDLAAIRFRVTELHATRIIYTHDSRQQQHFAQVFATAKKAGWAEGVALEYAPFGTMLGEDGRPFKTRAGGTVKLKDLLDEAEDRALTLVTEKRADMPEAQRRAIAHAIGIGAVKYSDLSKDRTSDYMFSWNQMLSFDGNTAPYLQNAHVRVQGIFRKARAGEMGLTLDPSLIQLESPYEFALAKHILRLGEVLGIVSRELKPHHLCAYLYELATRYHAFFENCPVNQSAEPTRSSRLALCDLTGRTLAKGLDLLGIEHPDQM